MNKYSLTFLTITISLFIVSCNLNSNSKDGSKQDRENEKLFYDKEGKLKAKARYDDAGKKHGKCYNYYKNGKVNAMIEYKHGKKHGKGIWYYENGKPYEITKWENGNKDSIRVRYYETGKIMAKIPYKNGKRIPGLIEYTEQGKQKTRPEIKISERNKSLLNNTYELIFQLSNESWKVDFFIFQKDNKYYGKQKLSSNKGIATYELPIHPDLGLMQKVVVGAEHKTRLGNLMILKDSINIAVDPI